MSSEDRIERVRADFPHLESCCYLNTGATGLAAPGAGAAAAAVFEQLLSRGYDGRPDWLEIAGRTAETLAALLNVAPGEIDFAASSSDALNRIMQAVPVAPGDRVVLAEDEFPTMAAVFGRLGTRGAEVVPVAMGGEDERTERLCAAAAGARYLGVSHVHWSTGTMVDLSRISDTCAKSGTRLIVDGVHAVGAVPVDASRADAYVTSFFKWTLAGFGLGAGIVRGPLRDELVPQQLGYANMPPSRLLRPSHMNYPGLAALERALDYMAGVGWDAIFARVRELREDLAGRLAEDGFGVMAPTDAAAGLVCVPVDHPEETAAALDAVGIRISPRGRALRVTPHFYNDASDNRRFCEALAGLEAS